MFESKTVVVSISIILLVTASFCKYHNHTEKKMGHHSEIISQCPGGKEYKKYCLNGGECYHLVDDDIVGSNCTLLYEGKRCQK